MHNRMKILIIPSWYHTEMENYGSFFYHQAKALKDAGHDVRVFYTAPYPIRHILRVKKIKWGRSVTKREDIPHWISYCPKTHVKGIDRFIQRLRSLVLYGGMEREWTPHIIHLHSFFSGDTALALQKRTALPLVVTEHFTGFARNILTPSEMKLARRVYARSQMNIAVSEPFARLLKEKTGQPFHYVPNLVDIDYFKPSATPGRQVEVPRFIMVGGLLPKKNHALLIRAFAGYLENHRGKLIIVGRGTEREALQSMIDDLGRGDDIRLVGFKTRDEVLELLQQSDYYLLSSRYETFGISMIEAMSTGLPALSTRCGGPESIITDETGLLVDDDVDAFLQGLVNLTAREWDRRVIRQHVIDNFSSSAVANKLTVLYSEKCQSQTE